MNWRGLLGQDTTTSGSLSAARIEWPGFSTTADHQNAPLQASYKT